MIDGYLADPKYRKRSRRQRFVRSQIRQPLTMQSVTHLCLVLALAAQAFAGQLRNVHADPCDGTMALPCIIYFCFVML